MIRRKLVCGISQPLGIDVPSDDERLRAFPLPIVSEAADLGVHEFDRVAVCVELDSRVRRGRKSVLEQARKVGVSHLRRDIVDDLLDGIGAKCPAFFGGSLERKAARPVTEGVARQGISDERSTAV